ncbi:hypothetical protein PR048_028379 [Dryococelus australis]|uniref:Uncharacterized protein n=1 Tax=Dryococelus australis TaxID=614101 RepID=A0ABQ9GJ35_9NEOP|nr:hypothetical protein PR048_028379 [Dryococelus australis]
MHRKNIARLVADNEELKDRMTSLENENVMLEMRAVELEEQFDTLSKERTELQAEVVIITQQLSSAVQGQNERLEVTQPAEEVGDHAGKNEKDSSNLEVVLRSLEAELVEARRALDEQKVVISDLNAKLDSKEEDLELQREMILKLEQLTAVDNRTEEENGSRITDILKDIGDVAADLEEWKMRCSEVEDRLKALEMEKMSLETRFEEVCSENRTLGAMLQEQKNMSDQLTDKLKDQSEGICARDANIVKLKTLIEENGLVLKERETALEEVRRVLDEVQGNFKRRYSELEASYQVKQAELEMQKASMQEVENVLVSKDSELKYLKMDLDKREYQLESLMNEHKIMKETLESSFQDKIQELSQQLTQMSCENQQLMQSINDLNNDIIVKNKYIEKLEIGMKNSEEVEKQWQITLDALNKTSSLLDSVKQELGAKSLECSELAQTLTVTEEQNREKIEKMKRLTANLKAKALALRGSEDKVKQLEAAIREKETALSELNEKLADGKNVVRTTELEAMLRNKEKELLHVKSHCEELTRMLHSKEGEVGLLAHEVTDLKRAVEELRHEKSYGENSSALAQTQNEVMVLKVKVDDKEREIELLRAEQGEWLRKCSDAEYKNNKLLLKITELEQKNTSLEVNTSHNTERVAELEEEVETKDFDYVAAMGKVEGLQGVISEQRQQFLESNAKQQDLDMVGRDMKIVELEEQISSIQERYQQTWAASEAKLQEREAVVESLEMELSRSQERVQSLENSVSEMGERQGTLESSLVALERQLEEAGQRLREEEEHRQLTEIELARLVTVEVSSKQRLEELLEKKVELESGMKEGTAERGELLKRIANLEASCRERSSEVERLSEFESAFNEESLQVQVLMLQVRQHAAEMEGKGRDLEESRQYCESLECDLRTCHEQLEEMDADRRNLVEERDKLVSKLRQVEENLTSASDEWEGKLNDQSNQIMQLQKEKEKLSDCLGSKIESIQQSDVDVKVDHVDFQKQISELSMQLTNLKEVMVQKEEEVKTYQTRLLQLQFCGQSQLTEDSETSFRSKISALEVTNTELRERILEYEKNIYNQQEHLAANAEESFQNQILELEVANVEMHGKIAKSEEMISDLHEQQLAGSAKETLQKKIWELEACNAELHGRVIHYQENISDLEEQLSRARVDLEGVYLKLNHNVEETRLLVEKVDLLQGELGMKNVEFQELSCKYQDIAGNSNSRVHMECKSKIAELHCEKNELLKQLLREKAASEVQNIIMLAEEQVRSVASTKEPSTQGRDTIVDESVQVKHVDEVAAVSFEQLPLCILEQTPVVHPEELIEQMSVAPGTLDNMLLYTARIQELEDHLAQLQHKLYTIKEDRDSAVARVKELEVQSKEAEQLAAIVSQPVPVVEEVCVQKSAYLTYQPDELSSMESRDPGDGASPPQEFHNITFFQEQSDSSFSLEVEPAVLEDESWGWGTDEARLEEEHLRQKQVSAPAPAVEVSDRLSSLEAELQALVVKKAAAEEEVNATQARCDKLLHKLKDIKIKNDNLMKENLELSKHNAAASSFGDLDSAIEEEFKIRIKSLEKSMKELMSELDVARLEREGLLKQIDVLTSANSRILEVKEKQDLDLDFCQKRYKEMSNAKEAMEWVLEELTEENKILSSKIGDLESELSSLRAESVSAGTQDENIQGRAQLALQELQEQLVVLAADNEHLQTLLEEQRNLRLKAEAGLSKKHGSSTTADTESRNKADVTCDDLRLENGTMTREVENLSRELVSVQSAYQSLKTRKEEYDRGITTNNSMVTKICDRCDSLQKQYEEVIESLTKEMSEVRRQYETRVKENVELVCWLETARRNLYELRKKCEKMAMKWLCGSVNMEEETIAFLQLRDEVRAAVVQLKISKEITMTSSSTIPAVERVECIISQLRQGLKENVADVESQTEAVAFKNEDIMHLQESVALRDSKLARFEEQVRYPSTWAGGDDGQGTEPLLLAREEELARLKREVDSLRQEATAADERALVKDEDIQSLRVQLAEKSHKLEEAVEARERDVDELRQLVEERDRDEHKLRRLQEEMAALREQSVSPADPETDDQSELDVALYMLHQRDVRCDELTLELMQVLCVYQFSFLSTE